MDTITELPGGQLVCRAHYLVICHKCGVDFTFIEEEEEEEEEEEDVWSNSDDDSRDHEQDFPSGPEVSTIEPQHTFSSARNQSNHTRFWRRLPCLVTWTNRTAIT
ncbi:hypothetical protein ED733_000661 [Metarhizium rileyi]|uniref:Uncharacterized protein n=1 Tax=Metarhizium rileyi (strain RCEF 4871) TaxID=1649241 RepID=A0A5C6G922_METRR|nr:hypothetical protein ED733_000661 [Metarhizium rileyi]